MDIVAKHADADADGVRIAELDEMSYRRLLWNHRPLTDFWRIGHRIAEKLNRYGMYTMGDVARQSIKDDELLYSLFGVNAELIIDHAWGWESCTMDMIKKYHPTTHSLSSGQVLSCPYDAKKAKIVVREMAESLALQLVSRKLKTDQIVLSIGYDRESLTTLREYDGEITQDHYGRMVPKRAHGSQNLMRFSSSSKLIVETTMQLYNRIIDFNLLIRRINITANHVITEEESIKKEKQPKQLHLFEEENSNSNDNSEFAQNSEKEHRIQEVMLHIKQEFGNNAILKGINFANGATARERNQQIGGHKA
jgi:DNA polymerase V